MNSIRKILVLSGREDFRERLAAAAEDFYDLSLELAEELTDALDVLADAQVEVVVVDTVPDFDIASAMDELVAAIDSMSPTPLLCFVGQREGVEMEASLVFTDDATAEELLGELSGVPTWGQGGEDPFDSGEAPRFIVPDSGFRQPATSGRFAGLVRRVMYVGNRAEFRQGLVAQAESRGVELILRDEPGAVVWPKGAQALSVVAVDVREDHGSTRSLVRYLRERHGDTEFRVAMIADDGATISEPVAQILGADYLMDFGTSPAQLFDTVFDDESSGLKGRMLVISSRNGLIRTIETVLGSEGLIIDVRRRTEEILSYVDEFAPDIILFDTGSRSLEAEELASQLHEERPHLRTRLLGVSQIDDVDASDSQPILSNANSDEQWDLKVQTPVSGEDLRRAVSFLLMDLERGRNEVDYDSLTRVQRSSALANAIESEMRQAAESDEDLLIVGLDIDDLSLLNVRYSWRLGDAVLRTLADTLSVAVGGRDCIFRHDDMFFVVRRGDQEACQATRRKIEDFIELFQRQTFRSEDGRGTYATVSGGAVIVPPLDIPPETVLEKCWIVLKRACASRRNNLLVAQLDPESFPSVASREKARSNDTE